MLSDKYDHVRGHNDASGNHGRVQVVSIRMGYLANRQPASQHSRQPNDLGHQRPAHTIKSSNDINFS
jgi:hypothetical protein